MGRPRAVHPRNELIVVRVTKEEKAALERLADEHGCSVSELVRLAQSPSPNRTEVLQQVKDRPERAVRLPREFLQTRHGRVFHGDALGLLQPTVKPGAVSLIISSPPFGLVQKDLVGN